ncbi:MAG: hypothetical protein K6A94_06600 [Bacteroidales bacterium]|nr:hypothetical protein [Bacteroidales bacterium]
MKKEDIMAALEAIGKSGVTVAGDLVLEKHVEHEVANVEAGGIGIQIVNGQPAKEANTKAAHSKKTAGAKPQKQRETMTLKRKGKVTEPHLLLLYMMLIKEQWIEGNEADFKALFSGSRDEDCELTWTGKFGKGTLVELFRRLAAAGQIEVPQGFALPAILEGHFKDREGKWLTGLDKGDPANDKALPVIQDCVKQLNIDPQRLLNGNSEDNEDFQSEYDRYDQQDLHWHKM